MKRTMDVKTFDTPDEVRRFDKGKLELVKVDGIKIGRATFEPGWRWFASVKPLAKTKSCEAPHFQYHISGVLKVVMDEGTERELRAGMFHCFLQVMTHGSLVMSLWSLLIFREWPTIPGEQGKNE